MIEEETIWIVMMMRKTIDGFFSNSKNSHCIHLSRNLHAYCPYTNILICAF